jgi:hypothetical protein
LWWISFVNDFFPICNCQTQLYCALRFFTPRLLPNSPPRIRRMHSCQYSLLLYKVHTQCYINTAVYYICFSQMHLHEGEQITIKDSKPNKIQVGQCYLSCSQSLLE